MNTVLRTSVAALACGMASAELLVREPFAYSPGDLTGNSGGSGWSGAWMDSGNPVVVTGTGLGYTDSFGNALHVSGNSLNTADGGAATTISGRETGQRDGELWISMLIQPQNNDSTFFGVSFYQGTLDQVNARFAIESVTAGAPGKDLRLTRRAPAGVASHTGSFSTTIGTPVFVVLHLVPDGGASEALPDRIEVFFNPRLDVEPSAPHATAGIDGLHFDRMRIAAANGRSALADEIRIGESYADVAPHTPPADPDTDLDGLTDAQEAVLGLDPNVSDAAFIAALRANSGWLSLHTADEITGVSISPMTLTPNGPASFEYSFEILDSQGFSLETIFGSLPASGDKRFLRLNLDTP